MGSTVSSNSMNLTCVLTHANHLDTSGVWCPFRADIVQQFNILGGSLGSICEYNNTHSCLKVSHINSFKWVESPQHGNGGSDWVEVFRNYNRCYPAFNNQIV